MQRRLRSAVFALAAKRGLIPAVGLTVALGSLLAGSAGAGPATEAGAHRSAGLSAGDGLEGVHHPQLVAGPRPVRLLVRAGEHLGAQGPRFLEPACDRRWTAIALRHQQHHHAVSAGRRGRVRDGPLRDRARRGRADHHPLGARLSDRSGPHAQHQRRQRAVDRRAGHRRHDDPPEDPPDERGPQQHRVRADSQHGPADRRQERVSRRGSVHLPAHRRGRRRVRLPGSLPRGHQRRRAPAQQRVACSSTMGPPTPSTGTTARWRG